MSNESFPDWFDLEAYFSEASSSDERARVEQWMAKHPEHRALAAKVKAVLDGREARADRPVRDWRHDDARAAIFARVRATPRAFATRWTYGTAVRWAAVALCGILAVLGIRVAVSPHTVAPGRVYATRSEQRATITLADGSTVTLAPNSRLDVPAGFGRVTRDVTLQGQALFSITNHRGAPFVVHTGAISARVLGTVFAVRRYALSEPAQVAVLSGKLSVSGRGAHVIITSGDVANVTDSTAITTTGRDLRSYTDWTNGRLVFDRAPVSELLTTVGRWYGYQFQLTDSALASQQVSTALDVSNRAEMLMMLKSLLDVTMTVDRNVITLTPRNAHSSTPRALDVFKPLEERGR